MFAPSELTCDRFLGGRLSLWQPKTGYRAGIDPVLLAAAVPARRGERILDLGCGAGAAALCLSARVAGLRVTGVEMQPDYADLARRNAAANDLSLDVVEADLTDLPAGLRQEMFSHVIANPPYFRRTRGTGAADTGRETALGGDTPLASWFDCAARRLRPRGRLTMIQRAERLPEMLGALDARLGSVCVRPLAPRSGRPAKLILLSAIKGGRAAFRLLAPLALHAGAVHVCDGDDYTPEISAVLREAAQLPWPHA